MGKPAMRIFNTSQLTEEVLRTMTDDEAANVYNGLDVCVTAEIYSVLKEQIDSDTPNIGATYQMALDKMAPIMEMSLRGTLIDESARQETIKLFEKELGELDQKFQRLYRGSFESESNMNWRSPVQLKNLFYGMLKLKEVKKRNQRGQYVATVNQEALELFSAQYYFAAPFANFILVLRNIHKQLGFLKTQIDRDQRMRCSYNIAGTNTGRLASSMSDFGTGTNLQNVNRKLRYPFVADKRQYMFNIDLEQADGRNVGAICWNLFHDMSREEITKLNDERDKQGNLIEWTGPIGPELAGSYLDACESGDLHTTVCRMVWPDLEWPEDESEWKSFCDGMIAHGQDSYRQLSKKGGHGTNYYGTPRTMAKHLHIARKVIEEFQKKYFETFPCIPLWHKYVIRMIRETGTLTTLFGRRRMFFGRGNEATTHRKAIAFEPQSMTGEQIDRGMLQVWRKYPEVQFLNQVHDSVLPQIPYRDLAILAPKILTTMQVPLTLKGGREFLVPLDAAGGWNWGYYDKKLNPHGLKGWSGKEIRERPTFKTRLKDYL